jgi:hypothetical protein
MEREKTTLALQAVDSTSINPSLMTNEKSKATPRMELQRSKNGTLLYVIAEIQLSMYLGGC